MEQNKGDCSDEGLRHTGQKGSTNMKGEFTTIIEKHGKWYVGYIEEISGVNTQGRTVKEVRGKSQRSP